MARVLCSDIDQALVKTRTQILEEAGHQVIAAMNQREVTAACKACRFDVAVIGQVCPPATKLAFFSRIRELCPSAKVLELYSAIEGPSLERADGWLPAPVHAPQELTEEVAQLANYQRKEPPAKASAKAR